MSATTEAPGALLERSDADLIAAVRTGDLESYGELFARHHEAARRLARQLTRGSGDADDLVSDAFGKVMEVLRRGAGPDEAFRAYLLTSVRRLHVDRTRVTSRVQATDDIAAFDAGVPFRDTAVAGFENDAAARAFASLPERWQLVLWHTEVEGAKPAEIAPLLGMSANSVAALAYRAREGLREAFLAAHAARTDDEDCRRTQAMLGSYVRGNASRRDGGKVEGHLEDCRRCTGIYLELVEVNSGLGALLAPLLLGGAASAYVGSAVGAGTVAAAGGWSAWLLAMPGRIRDLALANLPATAAAGVVTAVVTGGVVAGVARTPDGEPVARDDAATALVSPAPTPIPSPSPSPDADPDAAPPAGGEPREPRGGADFGPVEEVPVVAPFIPPTDPTAAEVPSEQPTDESTDEPTVEEPPAEPEPGPEPSPPFTAEGSSSSTLGLTWRVVLDVTSLPDGASGAIRVTSDRPLLALTLDPRCLGLALGEARCELGAGGYTFQAVPVPGTPTTMVFELTTDDGVSRTVRVPLS